MKATGRSVSEVSTPQQIEQKALRKVRAALYRDRIINEAFENELQGLSKK